MNAAVRGWRRGRRETLCFVWRKKKKKEKQQYALNSDAEPLHKKLQTPVEQPCQEAAYRRRDVIVPLLTYCRSANGSYSHEPPDQTSHPAGVKLSAPPDKLTMSVSAN